MYVYGQARGAVWGQESLLATSVDTSVSSPSSAGPAVLRSLQGEKSENPNFWTKRMSTNCASQKGACGGGFPGETLVTLNKMRVPLVRLQQAPGPVDRRGGGVGSLLQFDQISGAWLLSTLGPGLQVRFRKVSFRLHQRVPSERWQWYQGHSCPETQWGMKSLGSSGAQDRRWALVWGAAPVLAHPSSK